MSINYSVGANGVNKYDDTRYVQQLLNRQSNGKYNYGEIAVDGVVGPQTIGAITNFQANVVGMSYPDGRVDPGYQTIACLEQGAKSTTGLPRPGDMPQVGNQSTPLPYLRVNYRHGPRPSAGNYESEASFFGPNSSLIVDGSIYPDDMTNYGRIQDGHYQLWLGFHGRRGGNPIEQRDFKYKPSGGVPTPVLVVNRNQRVPIISDTPSISTSGNIHIHRGWSGNRGSEGCLTIQPPNWERVQKMLMEMYPNFSDWTGEGGDLFLGRQIGMLSVGPMSGILY